MSDTESGNPHIPEWPRNDTPPEISNLLWLNQHRYHLGEISVRAIARIVNWINASREHYEFLRFDEILTERDKRDLRFALRKLGGTEDILSGDDEEKLQEFQSKMSRIIDYPPEHPESIERALERGDWDALSSYNLDWLVEHHFDLICSRAQMVLDRIIAHINSGRTDGESKIVLGQDFLRYQDQKDLLHALRKLGGTDEVFADETRLKAFQEEMDSLLDIPDGESRSIEDILSAPESEILRYIEYMPRKPD